MEEFFTAVSNFGFPVVVAGYLLFRFENKLENLTNVIEGPDGLISINKELKKEIHELKLVIKNI